WPSWHPPKEMAERKPEIARYVEKGMGPGLSNPLGARALYLFNEKGQDTLFRLHGTPDWASIGKATSSGCIRMINQDVIDLYNRVRPGRNAKVVVIQQTDCNHTDIENAAGSLRRPSTFSLPVGLSAPACAGA